MRFVDSHLHFDSPDQPQVLALAAACQTLLFACGIDEVTSGLVLEQAGTAPSTVKAFVGLHPSEVTPATSLGWVPRCLEKATGLGEVGLDPKYSPVGPGSAQVTAFEAQLGAAQTQQKPVQVHSRGAETQCLELLGGYSLRSVLMHWFQSEERLPEVLDRGYFVSFGPPILYSKKIQRLAARCGPDHTLTETDSPISYGAIGEVHGPVLVGSVVFKLAEIWRTSFEQARTAVIDNAIRYLGPAEKG